MPSKIDSLKQQLGRSDELELTVTGRRSGRAISNPVWFVLDGERLHLLPVSGSETQWYKNVLQNPSIRIRQDSFRADLRATAIIDPVQVAAVTEQFRSKYGAAEVGKYYSRFDVAVAVELR